MIRPFVLAVLLSASAPCARAASIVIDDGACAAEVLFAAGFEAGTGCYEPEGSGGAAGAVPPGESTYEIVVPELGRTKRYDVRVPPGYDDARPLPVLVALHGQAASGSDADIAAAASFTRLYWSPVTDAEGVLVVTPRASGSQGGWIGNDAYGIARVLADVEARYSVDRRRRYLWGFSAGAHFAHAVVLDDSAPWAAYAIHAGFLNAYACQDFGSPACGPYLAAVAHRLPVSIAVGTGDAMHPYVASDPGRFLSAGWDAAQVRYQEFPGGHSYTTAQLVELWAWLGRYARAR